MGPNNQIKFQMSFHESLVFKGFILKFFFKKTIVFMDICFKMVYNYINCIYDVIGVFT